jgi:hypothetical protein
LPFGRLLLLYSTLLSTLLLAPAGLSPGVPGPAGMAGAEICRGVASGRSRGVERGRLGTEGAGVEGGAAEMAERERRIWAGGRAG